MRKIITTILAIIMIVVFQSAEIMTIGKQEENIKERYVETINAPDTRDRNNPEFWAFMAILSGGATTATFMYDVRCKRKEREEKRDMVS